MRIPRTLGATIPANPHSKSRIKLSLLNLIEETGTIVKLEFTMKFFIAFFLDKVYKGKKDLSTISRSN